MPVGRHAFDLKTFHLEVYAAMPPHKRIDIIDLNPEITTVTFSTVRPGGFQAMAIGYEHFAVANDGTTFRFSRIPANMLSTDHFAIVALHAGQHRVFQGRITQLDRSIDGVASFQAKGLGLAAPDDNSYVAPADQQFYSTAQVIAIIIQQCANNLISISPSDQWIDPMLDHHLLSEFDLRQGSQVIDQLTTVGDGGSPWDYFVWDMGSVSQPYGIARALLLPRTPPVVPQYKIPWDTSITKWTEISEVCYNHVRVTYTDADTGAVNQFTPWHDDTLLADRYGIDRSIVVPGGTICSRCADAFARTYLAAHRLPTVQATITRDNFRGVELYNGGQEYPPYLVRADEWVQVADYPTPLPIIRTEYNASTGELTLELGTFTPSYGNLIHTIHKTHSALVRSSNVNTGAKA